MTAAQFELLDAAAAERLIRRRFVELIDAGFRWDEAVTLATFVDVDVDEARRLLERGCPSATAIRILV